MCFSYQRVLWMCTVSTEWEDRFALGAGEQHNPHQAWRNQAHGGPEADWACAHQDQVHVGYADVAFHCQAWR